ncbi:MAG: L,D-transpeptidase family protein [Marinilabiliaceae bacterium]|nr:L,D-transpeptidase family protein [Marinilabiliaceae bacterium]
MSFISIHTRFLSAIILLLLFACNKLPNNTEQKKYISLTEKKTDEDIKPYIELLLLYKDSSYTYLQTEIKHIYKQHNYKSLWFNHKTTLNESAQRLIDTISQSHYYGLHPDFYPTQIIKKELINLNKLKSKSQILYTKAKIDLMITLSLIEFMSHIRFGMIRSQIIWSEENESYLRNKIMSACYNIIDNKNNGTIINDFQPQSIYYKLLSNALKKIALPDKLPHEDIIYKMDDKTKRDVLIILNLTGFFKGSADADLQSFPYIMRSYQKYYNISDRSILGAETLIHIMNQIINRFKILAVNFERLRQNPPLTKSYFWVNIPSYQLTIFENKKPVSSTKVIVGSPKTPTPILSGALTHIITYPKWNIPPSIVSKEIIPAIKRDSLYLQKKGYYITNWDGDSLDQSTTNLDSYTDSYYPFNIAQNPGSTNALGTIKFMFENNLDIYLHDTNARYLFAKKERALSHGCIRVENPLNLAKYLLTDESLLIMEKQMNQKLTGHILTNKNKSVYIRYITCEADEQGGIYYYKDIYNIDQFDWDNMIKSLFVSSMPIEEMTDF